MKVLDLTHTIQENMPVYPGTDPPKLLPANTYEKDGFKETLLQLFSHTGTHVDPPAHLFPDRLTLDQFPASQLIGKALVIDCSALSEGSLIGKEQLKPYGKKQMKLIFCCFTLDGIRDGDPMHILGTIRVLTTRCWTISLPAIIKESVLT